MQGQLEIVNRLRHSGIFEHALYQLGERPVFQRDHRPRPRRIRNRNALYTSSTPILRIRWLQSQKPRLSRLRLAFFALPLSL